jgi:leucyl-tRNA---protein transferase
VTEPAPAGQRGYISLVRPRWTSRRPPELVVHDAPHRCPYLPGREAVLPMRLPSRALGAAELDARLAEGDRRHGPFLYRPSCPGCAACQAIRLPVWDLASRRSHKRIRRKGQRMFDLQLGPVVVDRARLELYEKHKRERGLVAEGGARLDARGYRGFLVDSCSSSYELRFFDGDTLAAVAVFDRGERAMSAVYCLWDPAYEKLSLGTYAILEQVELCRRWGIEHLYLGLYVEGNPHMSYKARFRPHERLVDGEWRRF